MQKLAPPLKPGMQRPEVAHLHEALTLLGFTLRDDEQTSRRFGASTRAAVLEFQRAQTLPATGEVDEATAEAINAVLAERGALAPAPGDGVTPAPAPPPEDLLFIVEGEVVKPDGTPLPKHRVLAFDRAICDWRALVPILDVGAVSVLTDAAGRYRLTYDPAQLKAWGKARADLKVEVRDPATGDTVLAASPLILQARPHETVNFAIGAGLYRGTDEFTRVERALTPLLQPIEDLGCLDGADVMILARDSGLSNPSVACYVRARRWAAELDLPPAVFYGLLRRHQPAQQDGLLARPLSQLWSSLEQGRAQNVVNLPLNGALRRRLGEAQQRYLARPTHPLSRLLQTTSLDGEQQAVFTQRLTAGTHTGEAFWSALQTDAGFDAPLVAELRDTFEVQAFVADNTSLSLHLRGPMKVRAARDVAAFSLEEWRDTILVGEGVEIPEDVLPGAAEDARRAAYAQALYHDAEVRYPTPSLAAQMTRHDSWAGQPVAAFLRANPGFEFETQRITYFLGDHPDAAGAFPDPVAARQELLRLEQLFHLTLPADRLAAIDPLWQAGLRSAPQIAAGGRQRLLRRVAGRLDKPVVSAIYRKAVHVTAVAFNLFLRYSPQLNRISLPTLRTPQLPKEQALARAATDLPEWSELFGSADACACPHCESALSSGAYLVDIMDFLGRASDPSDPTNGKTGLDYLLERRPDLGLLQLTCANTETSLPQIDLVIELLEQIVAFGAEGTPTIPIDHVGQTTWDSAVLAAQPEHFEPAAYEKLLTARFPFDRLPFDLWLEEGRRYLKQMGVARDALMEVMPPRADVGALEIATEALQMSTPERELIAAPGTRQQDIAECWGVELADGTLRAQLGPVKALLKQARIDYETLLALLDTRYVNPHRPVAVTFAGDPCALDGALLTRADGSELSGVEFRAILDRLHRFMRLQRRLGWTAYELDTALRSLGVQDFDAPRVFPRLAAVQTLREALALPVSELCSWWGDLDTFVFDADVPSQYAAIFLDDAVFPDTHSGIGPDLRNDVFALNEDQSDLVITASTDPSLSPWLAESDGATTPAFVLRPDYAAYVQSATRLTAEDLLLLVTEVLPRDAATGHVAVNLVNVSLLYRFASFARALGIGVRDCLRLITVTGIAPLTTPATAASPVDTLEVKTRLDEISAGTLSLQQLAYLLLHQADAALLLGPTAEDSDGVLALLSPAYAGIQDTSDLTALEVATANAELTATLTQSLGSSLGVDDGLLTELLFTRHRDLGRDLLAQLIVAANPELTAPPVASRSFHEVFETLHKFALAWNALGLDASHLGPLMDADPGLPDLAAPPLTEQGATDFAAWRKLTGIAGLQVSAFTVEQSLFALLATATLEPPLPREALLLQASESTGWSLADLTFLTGPDGFDFAYPLAFRRPDWLLAVEGVFSLLRPLGVSAAQAHAWTVAELPPSETEAIKQALTLAYDHQQWLEVMAGLQDELRVLKRDALLGVLMGSLATDNSDDIYRHYLIDPAMAPCALTSRIVEATGAVQLFAQRILLNLEPLATFERHGPPLAFSREDAQRWQWRKNYRVWEAARKVFLFPENWLEPELRDGKSVFFEELEEGLLQDEVTPERAERLYGEYLTKLDQVSRLEILGLYEDTWSDGGLERSVLHVFGRTRDIPALYFYRRWEDHARWTPWERVELDIQGHHLVPIVYNGRLYLFWSDFKVTQVNEIVAESSDVPAAPASTLQSDLAGIEEQLRNEYAFTGFDRQFIGDQVANPNIKFDDDLRALLQEWVRVYDRLKAESSGDAGGDADPAPSLPYEVELQMAWSEYHDGTWSAKKLADTVTFPSAGFSPTEHFFSGWVSAGDHLRIALRTVSHESTGVPEYAYLGFYYFDLCQSSLKFSKSVVSAPEGTVYASGSVHDFQSWRSSLEPGLSLEVGPSQEKDVRTLLATRPGTAYVHYAHQYGIGGSETSPFFYADTERTYFVEPRPEASTLGALDTLSDRGRLAGARTVTTGAAGALSSATHFQGASTGVVVDRGSPSTAVAVGGMNTQIGWLDAFLQEDSQPTMVAGQVALTAFRYRFTRFYHPYTCLFLKQLSRYGVDGLLDPDPESDDADTRFLYRQLTRTESFSFEDAYAPDAWVENTLAGGYPNQEIDFSDPWSPYALHNWELFFHIPLLMATRLMQNQRFADARRWFHYIFDPTHTDGTAPSRFWKIKPFFQEQGADPAQTLQELIDTLEQGNLSLEQQIQEWEADPFRPHVIARLRTVAYMKTVVMKYLDCLIGEADMLFLRDDRESITEAAQLYLLAAETLGDKPTVLPAQEAPSATANQLLGRIGSVFEGSLIDHLGGLTSLIHTTLPGGGTSPSGRLAPLQLPEHALGATSDFSTLLQFCIPYNETLYGYWDTVADRLFKIRHCMNLAGQVRQLPLFAPPIDPGLLVRAVAAGIDLASILSSLYEPLPKYRFGFMLQKALEFCGEVRSLGGALLAALEKGDGEALARLRTAHEVRLLQAVRELKQKALEEATRSREGIEQARAAADFRRGYYSQKPLLNAGESAGLGLQAASAALQTVAQLTKTSALPFFAVPKTITGTVGPFPAALAMPTDWEQMTAPQTTASEAFSILAAIASTGGSISQTVGGYQQRKTDWDFQAGLAEKDIAQFDKQILAAEIRQQIAEKDLQNCETQIAQAEETEAFLKLKFTNQELYSWMLSTLSTLYFQAYQMAFRLAKQAEQTFRHELGPDEAGLFFVQPAYWDSLKKGLTAGEQLGLDLRRMEMAHLEANRRELEITKHISLAQLDPAALLTLRDTGSCDFHVPEVLFAMDFAGHYYRRIKLARLTIPCVTGPFTNVSATLSLTQAWIRREAKIDGQLETMLTSGLPPSAVATSSSDRDAGLFELTFNDPRYLPFEGAGAVSSWRLQLPTTLRPFDYDSISDVVLHLSYTARDADDGGAFKSSVESQLQAGLNDLRRALNEGQATTLARLISLRHEFPVEWSRLQRPADGVIPQVMLALSKRYFPRYLDYIWQEDESDALTARPITLNISSVTTYLKTIAQGSVELESAAQLSRMTISNEEGSNLTITLADVQSSPETWKDLHILLRYTVDS